MSPPAAADPFEDLFAQGDLPRLKALLKGPDGLALREELLLAFYRIKRRATRTQLTRVARLQGNGYDEVVMLSDISKTGVRLLVQRDCPLDVNKAGALRLAVASGEGLRSYPVQLVRVCVEDEGKHLAVACRFLDPGPSEATLSSLRSLIFEAEGPEGAEASAAASAD